MLKTTLMQSINVIAISLLISITVSITMANADSSGLPTINIDTGAGASSTQLPKYYPTSFQGTGTIHALSSNSITITGSTDSYSISPNILVHSMSTEFSSRRELRRGKQIGYSFTNGMNNKRTITEIWFLPRGILPKL